MVSNYAMKIGTSEQVHRETAASAGWRTRPVSHARGQPL